MILTQCPVCAAQLPETNAKQCSRCKTRYCGLACQVQHWKEGGHDNLCKLIKKAGGAEQYNANQKYAEAVAAAVEKCADDTKGQTCFICTQALHWKTKEGLVRGCACRGTAGFAHVSCLAEQAKILHEDAVANNKASQWHRWYTCSLCEQEYHGAVRCALGWACWKTYVGRPEVEQVRGTAMSVLGNGLFEADHYEDALSVQEAELAMLRRLGADERNILVAQTNLATTYGRLGREEQALRLKRDVYSGLLKLDGDVNSTFRAANNYADSLTHLTRHKEAKTLLRKTIPVARRVLGDNDETTLRLRWNYAETLYSDPDATIEDLREAVTILEETDRTARRVLGNAHPIALDIEGALKDSRASLGAREAGRRLVTLAL
jgi:tetratricopeptide (TPR) repeat protein